MPFEVNPDPGEEVIFFRELRPTKHTPLFAIAISNFAIYLPAKKLFAKKDPWYFRKVLLSQISRVSLERLNPIYLWLLAGFMVIAGAVTLFFLIGEASSDRPTDFNASRAIGYAAALFTVGFIIPFFAKGRRALVIRMVDETYRWKPQLVVDRASRKEIEELQEEILQACKTVGISTVDAIR